ncbi:MAG: HEPN domain-containing protein [Spirochaetaceae bacterium]|nr:HEPN domain-containing protein [Spirochaetaceae bacterium]
MAKDYVTESSSQLIDMANKDIVQIISAVNNREYPVEYSYENICFHATQAVEKYLKGYIVGSNKNVEKIHNLTYLRKSAENIDKNFIKIENECFLLNKYAFAKYGFEQKITDKEVSDVLKALITIYEFEPLQKIRERFESEGKIIKLIDVKNKLLNKDKRP